MFKDVVVLSCDFQTLKKWISGSDVIIILLYTIINNTENRFNH